MVLSALVLFRQLAYTVLSVDLMDALLTILHSFHRNLRDTPGGLPLLVFFKSMSISILIELKNDLYAFSYTVPMESGASTDEQAPKIDKSDSLTSTAVTNDFTVLSRRKRQSLKRCLVIWCDPDINQNQDIQTTIQQLKRVMPCVLSTNDFDECKQWLMQYHRDKRIFFIVSNKFGKQIVPDIHSLSWLIAIYVYCTDRKIHTRWTADYPKVRGVISNTNKLIQKLSMDVKNSECLQHLDQQDLLGKLSFSKAESSHKKYIGATTKGSQAGIHIFSK